MKTVRTRRRWRVALWSVCVLLILLLSGAVFLFSGSRVPCEDIEDYRGVRLECVFEAAVPAEVVWASLTRTDQPLPYYFDAILEAEMRVGGRWRFLTDDRERLLAGGEITAMEPPRRFQQTFVAADLDDPPSRITVHLEETDDGCSVTLIHDRFPGKTETYRRFRRAHPIALSALVSLLEEGELPLRARLYILVFKPGMKLFTVRAQPWTSSEPS